MEEIGEWRRLENGGDIECEEMGSGGQNSKEPAVLKLGRRAMEESYSRRVVEKSPGSFVTVLLNELMPLDRQSQIINELYVHGT